MKALRTIGFMTITVFFCLQTSVVYSKEVSQTEAERIAQSWITQNFDATIQVLYGSQDSELICTEIKRNKDIVAYSFEKPQGGFVLVAGDDKMGKIIAYSEINKFDPNIPPIKKFLDTVYDVLNKDSSSTSQTNVHSSSSVGKVGPLMSTTWNQNWPYNADCPTTYQINHSAVDSYAAHTKCIPYQVYRADSLYHSGTPVGCVAVAMGQIMKYHGYPPQGYGSHEYEWQCTSYCQTYPTCTVTAICRKTKIYVDFGITHDWDNIATSLSLYSSSPDIARVSKLLYHVGVAVEMNYSCEGSGALSVNARDALRKYFDYESSAEYVCRDFDTAQWFTILSDEITSKQPVYYGKAGHAFVLDGVDDTRVDQLYVHLNYGWGGASDGWYDIGFFRNTTLEYEVVLGITPAHGSPGGGAGGQPSAPSGTTGPRESSGGCFIATAAYETSLAEEVKMLSRFRDEFLLKNTPGRFFVKSYYKISPDIAGFIQKRPLAKKIIRLQLKPVIFIANLFVSNDKVW